MLGAFSVIAYNVQGLPSGTALKYKVDLTIKSKIDMKKLSLPPSAVLATNLLLVAVLVLSVFYAAYNFGTNLKKDIADKKELDSLRKEELRLQIKLKQIELSKYKIVVIDSGLYIPTPSNGN